MISSGEDLVQICEVVDGELRFTKDYVNEMKGVVGSARKFASHLTAGWEREFSKALDYFGPDELDENLYSGIDGEAMDVCEIIPFRLASNNVLVKGLSADWFRDLLRYKLINLKLPRRLLQEYIKQLKANL